VGHHGNQLASPGKQLGNCSVVRLVSLQAFASFSFFLGLPGTSGASPHPASSLIEKGSPHKVHAAKPPSSSNMRGPPARQGALGFRGRRGACSLPVLSHCIGCLRTSMVGLSRPSQPLGIFSLLAQLYTLIWQSKGGDQGKAIAIKADADSVLKACSPALCRVVSRFDDRTIPSASQQGQQDNRSLF
jgi:hypothetical protein